jgi:hypothetical protein
VLAAGVVGMLGLVAPAPVQAQIQEGATMTVLQGQVTVVRGDGSAIQPAPSGTVVNVGDEIRTLSNAGALVTFFAGTEVELGEETVLAVEAISKSGDRIDVSLRQVFGQSIHRVQTIAGSGSEYRVNAGGAVALVRGTTFAVIGPVSSPVGDIVILVCLDDCDGSSSFAGCMLVPGTAIGVVVGKGEVQSKCETFAVKPGDGFFNSGNEAVSSLVQMLGGNPNGSNNRKQTDDTPNGSPQEEEEEEDDDYD